MVTSTSRPSLADDPQTQFSGDRAMERLRAQCRLGPRPPDTAAHEKCLELITRACHELDLETTHQSFRAHIPLMGKTVRLTNVIAIHQPKNPRRIMLSAHWDTRPVADREPVRSRARTPIIGANDGASGVAILLELARVFRESPPKVGVVFAFFDGEDAGEPIGGGGYCLGSDYLARNLKPAWKFEKGINLDMVGDKNLALPIEQYSWQKARALCTEVWEIGSNLYPSTFITEPGPYVFDDHRPFLDRGMPYIDIIDFEYAYWHTLEDTEDKCSPESLERVGRVIARFVQSQ